MHGRRPGRWCNAGQTKFNFYFIDFSQLAAGFLTFARAGGRPASQKNFPPCPVLAQASEIPKAILSLPGRDTPKCWALIVPYTDPVPTAHPRLRRFTLCSTQTHHHYRSETGIFRLAPLSFAPIFYLLYFLPDLFPGFATDWCKKVSLIPGHHPSRFPVRSLSCTQRTKKGRNPSQPRKKYTIKRANE